ncbi:amidase [Propionicimonas paludicola]|uniref:Amidase n=1 Tax=Propionicimonas paludicola TaxID=185243 RepID=A0A2A9CU59_9ACTN|nr:amidase [Propionicimonas paludicola]PFG17671.1 amidase [Propionicimonas paludicola]
MEFVSFAEQARRIASGQVTSAELVEESLAQIQRLDHQLNAFVAVLDERARAEAAQRDATPAAQRGPLHGVPIAIKDENDVAGLPTAYGGAAFRTPAAADSEVVRRLREAGAVIVGKTRMPEFGIWPWTETSANGYTRNPWNPMRSTAGSSGGSAAAVASGMVAAAIGGDGGGSIRLPSSWCGLYGLKCQRGRTSAAPNAHLWRSLGVIGPLTRTVEDSALIYDAITGSTPIDTWRAGPLPISLTEAYRREPGRLRIGYLTKFAGASADAETTKALLDTADALAELGHLVEPVDPKFPNVSLTFMAQTAAGVAEEAARAEYPELLERRTRTLMRLTAPLRGLAGKAERDGQAAGAAFAAAYFGDHDLLLMPTTPSPAVPVGQLDGRGALAATSKATATSGFTSIWNVLGNPAAAIPSGFSSDGLPLSVQLVGAPNGEPTLIQVSAQLERVRPWAQERPPLS